MKLWKFVIPPGQVRFLLSDPAVGFDGCLAVVLAPSEVVARMMLHRSAEEHGDDVRWLEVADVREFPLSPAVVAWAIL